VTRPDERRFALFPRGHVRDNMLLAHMRNQMRGLVNPDTGALFTEDEIQRITQQGGRYYIEADAIDLFGQAVQARSAYFVDQIRPTRAASSFLQGMHGPLWLKEGNLPAEGGTGTVTAQANAGVIFVGSTTLPDPAAQVARDSNGKRYQVLVTGVANGSGVATLTMKGIDGGDDTNLAIGAELTWVNPPLSSEPTAVVATSFTGGVEAETDADYAERIEDRIRHRPAAGNQAHFSAWTIQASSSAEKGFVYASALHAGSVVVCVTQKRSNVIGPLARIPNLGTLAAVTGYLVPPSSPVVPGNVFVLVVPPQATPSSVGLRLGLRRGTSGGWGDVSPWPRASTLYPRAHITTVTNQQDIRITTDEAPFFVLPATGANAPQLMLWNPDTSVFEKLLVSSLTSLGGNVYRIQLTAPPARTMLVDDVVSPYTDRKDIIAAAVQTYFDSLGPGELVDFATDVRAHRAFRYPRPNEGFPQKVGQGIVTVLLEELGGVASDAELVQATVTQPTLPANVTDGPRLLTLKHVGVYDFED
jgi:hypothetical protein